MRPGVLPCREYRRRQIGWSWASQGLRQRLSPLDILPLRALVASAQQNQDLRSAMQVVDAVTRPVGNSHFHDALPDASGVPGISLLHAANSGDDARTRRLQRNGFPPPLWGRAREGGRAMLLRLSGRKSQIGKRGATPHPIPPPQGGRERARPLFWSRPDPPDSYQPSKYAVSTSRPTSSIGQSCNKMLRCSVA